jgi:hypothetical protein
MQTFFISALATLCLLLADAPLLARMWTDATGHYTVNAELIGFDSDSVVLQREDHHLVQIEIAKLSAADQEYIKSKEAKAGMEKMVDAMQTWTTISGLKVEGRVVDYVQKEVTIQRRRGRLKVNDRVFDNLPPVYQTIVMRVVEHFEKTPIKDREALDAWSRTLRARPRTFSCEGVLFELANGDEYAIPFFLFADDDRAVLEASFADWKQAQADEAERAEASFRLQALAAARQHDREVTRQIAQMQLGLTAVVAGVTSLWEVTLYPGNGMNAPPLFVMAEGRDSRTATLNALANNPGYVAGPVRRLNRW